MTSDARAREIRKAFDQKAGFIIEECHLSGRCIVPTVAVPAISFRRVEDPPRLAQMEGLTFVREVREPMHDYWRITCEGVVVADGSLPRRAIGDA